MKIGDNVVIEGTATIENLPISNSSLSAIVQTDGNLFKRELGTISTASKESYIPGLSIAFPSIFNLNTESLDYNNRSLVVSLKNQLQGTVFMAPVSMNGTPGFRYILKSDLANASVVFTDDNTFVKKIGDTMSGVLDFSTATQMINNSGVTFLSKGQHGTILANNSLGSSSTVGVVIRPLGCQITDNQTVFSGDGFIRSSIHGDSSQWKQAYDRGDHAGLYLVYNPKATLSLSSSSHNLNDNLIGSYEAYVHSGSTNKPTNQGGFLSQRYFQSGSINYISQIYNTLDGNEMYFRVNNDTNGSTWNRIWHSRNLTKLSQLQNDQGYVTTDTTYTAGNDLIINEGTSTVNQLWNAKVLNNWAKSKFWNFDNLSSRAVGGTSADANTWFNDKTGGMVASYGTGGWLTNGAFFGYGGLIHFQGTSSNMALQMHYEIGHNTNDGGRLAIRTKHNGGYTNWKEVYHTGNLPNQIQTLTLGNSMGSISISDGNNIRLDSLALRDYQDSTSRLKDTGLLAYRTLAGNIGYPYGTVGGGIRWERVSNNTNQTGFHIHKASGQDLLWYKTFDGENTENSWKMFADRDWVAAQGFSTQTLTAGTNIQISANNVISATNTTYPAITLADLNTGTATVSRTVTAKVISDYVVLKIAQGADSIWEHTPQGGLRIRNYDSLATRDGAIAIGRGSGATKYNAIGIGTAANSDGNSGLAIGELSANTGTYGLALGPYSVNTAMEGVVIGPFLQNNQRGCTVTGRYNDPILSTTTNTINNYSPLFIIGNGKSASIRSNAYEMFSDGKGEFSNVQSYKTQHSFGDMDIPNWKFIQENISGGGSGTGSEDWVSKYGSGISVFNEEKAHGQLSNSDYGSGSGEILSSQKILNVSEPTVVYLGNDGQWRKWNDTSNSEQLNVGNTAVLGILLGDMKSILLKGYYSGHISKELEALVYEINNGKIFHTFNKGALMAHNATSSVNRVFGYSVNERVAYFNPWMF
ncbi:hypothetical protein [Myroides odoratus]|uniref:Uncharacterized protein n=1 Tax=Myroides odoratus TaxID=256 RepID=A0A9Q6Z2P7_MYROD|nr:hypothetical protein [Myroides odoratus]EHQ41554.1 hypothetical protein Myrod_0718 [Myroides odoratus DSM 2801]EKB02749.1 hypothetical protein HMPREF9716_03682 [Myroides odoratus CIP 103059]QQT98972.1 hypothetical protein I6I88_12200 [Myroides odoratus]WQD58839.1 hypothetical protein U0010_06775 [Myroides odoratus]STZ28817.1 Uncharacterised protein [Myroides odoratus]